MSQNDFPHFPDDTPSTNSQAGELVQFQIQHYEETQNVKDLTTALTTLGSIYDYLDDEEVISSFVKLLELSRPTPQHQKAVMTEIFALAYQNQNNLPLIASLCQIPLFISKLAPRAATEVLQDNIKPAVNLLSVTLNRAEQEKSLDFYGLAQIYGVLGYFQKPSDSNEKAIKSALKRSTSSDSKDLDGAATILSSMAQIAEQYKAPTALIGLKAFELARSYLPELAKETLELLLETAAESLTKGVPAQVIATTLKDELGALEEGQPLPAYFAEWLNSDDVPDVSKKRTHKEELQGYFLHTLEAYEYCQDDIKPEMAEAMAKAIRKMRAFGYVEDTLDATRELVRAVDPRSSSWPLALREAQEEANFLFGQEKNRGDLMHEMHTSLQAIAEEKGETTAFAPVLKYLEDLGAYAFELGFLMQSKDYVSQAHVAGMWKATQQRQGGPKENFLIKATLRLKENPPPLQECALIFKALADAATPEQTWLHSTLMGMAKSHLNEAVSSPGSRPDEADRQAICTLASLFEKAPQRTDDYLLALEMGVWVNNPNRRRPPPKFK